MAEIINLKDIRKARARSAAESKAAENRARFGRTRDERNRLSLEDKRSRQEHEGNRLDRLPPGKTGEKSNKGPSDSDSGKG